MIDFKDKDGFYKPKFKLEIEVRELEAERDKYRLALENISEIGKTFSNMAAGMHDAIRIAKKALMEE